MEINSTVADTHQVYQSVRLIGPEVTHEKCSVLSALDCAKVETVKIAVRLGYE